jgi:hypothetical protein
LDEECLNILFGSILARFFQNGSAQVRPLKSSSGQDCFAEVGLEKVGTGEVGTAEIGPAEVSPGQVCRLEICAFQIGPAQVGAGQACPAQVAACKIGSGQIAFLAAVGGDQGFKIFCAESRGLVG